jgi:SAM-dependent methyltransferase
MVDGWQWDKSLFKGASAYYERGRLPYAPGFDETLAAALGLDGSGRLLDVGCGPGIVTLALAPRFAEVVGVDPDEDMLAEAERQAARRGVANARWVAGRAEDLPAGLGPGRFRAAVFAQSFHWTDRDLVAAAVLTMLEPGGAFVLIADLKDSTGTSIASPPVPAPLVAPPRAEIQELVRRYLGPVRRAGRGTLPDGTPGREDLVLARAGFEGFERHVVPAGQIVERSADDIVAWVYSKSGSAPHLFGDRLADFELDLRTLLREAVPAPDGGFGEPVAPTEIRIWRKPRVG